LNTLIDFRILPDFDISAHYRRPVEDGEEEDSKQSFYVVHMPHHSIDELPDELKTIAEELWTPEVIENYKTKWGIE
jgi:hypothetical protein